MVLLVSEHPSGHMTLWIKIDTGLIGGDTIRRIGTKLGEQLMVVSCKVYITHLNLLHSQSN